MTANIEAFFAIWGGDDPQAILVALSPLLADPVSYSDPRSEVLTSAAALAEYLAMFGRGMPGASAKIVTINTQHGAARVTVEFQMGGKAMMRGQYFVDLAADGRLARITGFTGTGES